MKSYCKTSLCVTFILWYTFTIWHSSYQVSRTETCWWSSNRIIHWITHFIIIIPTFSWFDCAINTSCFVALLIWYKVFIGPADLIVEASIIRNTLVVIFIGKMIINFAPNETFFADTSRPTGTVFRFRRCSCIWWSRWICVQRPMCSSSCSDTCDIVWGGGVGWCGGGPSWA